MRLVLTVVAMLALATSAVGWATSGFQVLTSEGARRLAVAREPVPVPDARVVPVGRDATKLLTLLREDGRVTLVTFIYTRCTGLCAVMSNELRAMQDTIIERGLQEEIALVTISFDPSHDSVEVLSGYARNIGADASVWRLASVSDAGELARLLEVFGIVAVPDGLGGFEHNAAFHVVRPSGELVVIVDASKPRTALARAVSAR